MTRRLYVAVCGAGSASAREATAAEAVGRLLAEAGAVVVTGGLGGVMEAASRGAAAAGGLVVGLLPGADPSDANEHCTVAVATGLGEARNAVVVRSADAVVAVGGEFGTLSEIALARRMGLEVVGLRSWTARRHGSDARLVTAASTPAAAARLALQAAARRVAGA